MADDEVAAVVTMTPPDLVVFFGPRAILSLVGIVTLVLGVWHVDRTWDEKGSAAYAKAAKAAKRVGDVVKIPQKELDDAFVFPFGFLVGWIIYACAYLFPVNGSTEIEVTSTGMVASAASLALAVIASVPMGDAVKNRRPKKKKLLGLAFVSTWLILTISTIQSSGDVPIVLCPLGAFCIILSMNILWKYRKMGDTWEQEGKPNPNPIVYNMGGPLFVFGWFLFWLGLAATSSIDEKWDGSNGLPIYYTLRTAIAMSAGCGMVPVVMMVDFAHDEGAKYTGFGTDGEYFGWWEKPYAFVISWIMFGVAALLPFTSFEETTTRQWIILANCTAQGFVAGILIQNALYRGDMAAKTKWSIPFLLLFVALAINIGMEGGLALALALPGAILIVFGQKTVFGDRKRGDYFMEKHEANPNPVVYSYGEPAFMAGWILISLAMSLPM